mgnify:CR=1 FL=1
MDVNNITLEITTVTSLITTIVGLLTFWFKMDKKQALQDAKISELERNDLVTHNRIDSLKKETVKNTESLNDKYDSISTGVHDLKVEMEKNKGEILSAIEKIKAIRK